MSGADRNHHTYQPPDRGGYHDQSGQPYDFHNISPIEERTSYSFSDPVSPPPPPAHRYNPGNTPGSSYGQYQSERQYGMPPANARRESLVTPGMDNISDRAPGGGINGVAIGVANANERESGVQALRDIDGWGRSGNNGFAGRNNNGAPSERRTDDHSEQLYSGRSVPDSPRQRPLHPQTSHNSYSSAAPLAGAAYTMGTNTPTNYSERSLPLHPNASNERFNENPYNRWSNSHGQFTQSAFIDPNTIEDDGEDFPREAPRGQRRSMLPFGHRTSGAATPASSSSAIGVAGPAGVAGAAVGGAALGSMAQRDASGHYAPVARGELAGSNGYMNEKSQWLQEEASGRKRMKWYLGVGIAIIIVGGLLGGILGGVVFRNRNNGAEASTNHGQSAADDTAQNGDLDLNSKDIKGLLNNPNLKKVFPGMDYTPLNSQYPECMHSPPSQNNVTRDVAVLSQLTNSIRLYGTDCNQTQMVLHALDRLQLPNIKLWLGVHQDSNETTNARQIEQMWDILDTNNHDRFKGIIVGNEILYRQDMTATQLTTELTQIRSNMTARKISLPLASADLGDKWDPTLASAVDIVMANIHPFFGGVTADAAAGWTWSFWKDKNVGLATNGNDAIKHNHIVSEVGWPSAGGNNCGSGTCTSTAQGSVAGIDEMNTFMENYVCQSLSNGTVFFWFEAFDEPWKIQFNEPDKGKQWEDKWGLLDVNRNLKPGVKIPDCKGLSLDFADEV